MAELFAVLLDSSRTAAEHARLCNTFSLMEYIGARKIFKSQAARDLDVEILSHAAEEARHALVFKRLALRLDSGLVSYGPEHVWAGGSEYMQAIDRAAVELGGGDTTLAYCYTTMAVEERALAFYPRYADALAAFTPAQSVRSIVKEEGRHMDALLQRLRAAGPASEDRLGRLRRSEQHAFQTFIAQVVRGLSTSSSAASLVG